MFVMAGYRIVQYCNRTTDKKMQERAKNRLKYTGTNGHKNHLTVPLIAVFTTVQGVKQQMQAN